MSGNISTCGMGVCGRAVCGNAATWIWCMNDRISEDIAELLASFAGYTRLTNIFILTDAGVNDNRPLAIVVKEERNDTPPEITETVDYLSVAVTIAAPHGHDGGRGAIYEAMRVYRALHGITDVIVDDTLYLSIVAACPPVHTGFDEHDRKVYEIKFDIIRFLGVA